MRLINADALKDVLKNWRRTIDPYDGYWNGFNTAFDKSIEAIDNAPTIEAEPKHGRWSKEMVCYEDENGYFHFGYQCSQCKAILNKTKRCGECGAIMDEVEE